MRVLFFIAVVTVILSVSPGCGGSGSASKTFCDTACLKDTLKFTGSHVLKPYAYILVRDCKPDSLLWSYSGLGTNRKTKFDYTGISLNKDFVRCVFNDTSYACILFNDCLTGRGFQIKLPYDKKQSFSMRSSGINNMDPKFSVADNMLAYTDRGNIYVEEITSGKKAMMTFGQKLDIDYDAIHEYIDSVHVTIDRIWVKILVDKQWKEMEKKIVLE
jgi:hypothetical protein